MLFPKSFFVPRKENGPFFLSGCKLLEKKENSKPKVVAPRAQASAPWSPPSGLSIKGVKEPSVPVERICVINLASYTPSPGLTGSPS